MKPPLPLIIFETSAWVYFPLKQSFIKAPDGSPPDLSGEKGPSPSKALATSITLPFLWAPTETPPPIWTTIKLRSSYAFPTSFAYLLATAFWFNAWKIEILGISGWPESLATSCNSSTTTGSTIYDGTLISDAISLARIPPKLEACCPCFPIFKSSNNSGVVSYVPPGIGLRRPPRPTTTSISLRSTPFSFKTSRITSFLKSFWS